jgi:hypothetical protein
MGFLNGRRKTKRGGVYYLADLAKDNGVIEGFRFEECHVKGPAVMVVQGELDLVNNTIEGDPDAFLWEIQPDRERVTGAILIKDTTFEGCTFTNVGLAGYSDFIEQVRQGVEARHALP